MPIMPRKNLKVSEIVHEELGVRKRRDESFDDVLKRELGIIPTAIDDLVTYFPDELAMAAETIAKYLRDKDRFDEYVIERDDGYNLVYDSKESGRTIMELRPVQDDPSFVGIYYRNDQGGMVNICDLVYVGVTDLIAHGSYIHPGHGGQVEYGGEVIYVDELEDDLKLLRDTAYERWG